MGKQKQRGSTKTRFSQLFKIFKMSRRFTGSIDLTAAAEAVRAKHSAVNKGNNGHTYVNVVIWENDTPDQYGNIMSVQLQSKQDAQEAKVYIGRAKLPQPKPETQAPEAAKADEGTDLPF
jgi:hypothetical protein